jgi:hypothetical protein
VEKLDHGRDESCKGILAEIINGFHIIRYTFLEGGCPLYPVHILIQSPVYEKF